MYNSETNSWTFYQSRYYDDVFGQRSNFPVPTSQTKDKSKKIEFKQRVIAQLNDSKKENWPYKNRLTITVEVIGSENYIKRVDIDNVLKLLLDTLKSRVFIDDKQIYSIMASKTVREKENGEEEHGFLVGLRSLTDNEINQCIPKLFSEFPTDGIENGLTTMWKAIEDK